MFTFQQFYAQWQAQQGPERFGQYFVNRYIKGQWAELFYEVNTQRAVEMVRKYLVDLDYYPEMPTQVRDI
jgi:hypothetical protein